MQPKGADDLDIEAMIAAQPSEWSLVVDNNLFDHVPKTMTSAEDAILMLGYVAKCWHPTYVRIIGEGSKYLNRDEVASEYKSKFDSWMELKSKLDSCDARLASFVTNHPGKLESLLGDQIWQERFALTQTRKDAEDRKEGKAMGGLPTSVMSNFLNEASFVEDEFLWRSMRACDQLTLLRSVLSCQSRFKAVFHGHEPWELLSGIARSLGPERFSTVRGQLEDFAPPELLDVLVVWACGNDEDAMDIGSIGDSVRLPDILPSEDRHLVELGSDEISDRIASYRGVTVPDLHANLVKEGFLGEGENIGELILHDAMTLQNLGVSRHSLADSLLDAFHLV